MVDSLRRISTQKRFELEVESKGWNIDYYTREIPQGERKVHIFAEELNNNDDESFTPSVYISCVIDNNQDLSNVQIAQKMMEAHEQLIASAGNRQNTTAILKNFKAEGIDIHVMYDRSEKVFVITEDAHGAHMYCSPMAQVDIMMILMEDYQWGQIVDPTTVQRILD